MTLWRSAQPALLEIGLGGVGDVFRSRETQQLPQYLRGDRLAQRLFEEWIYLAVLLIDRNAMRGTGENFQISCNTISSQFLKKSLRLLYRNPLVLTTVQ